jgi:hypothetical protein
MARMHLDHSVYPDLDEPPEELTGPADRADYVHRICSAWDFGIVPDHETFELFRAWRDIFEAYRLPASPAYHAFRAWFGWPTVGRVTILDSHAEQMDRREGRGEDPGWGML